jgi:epoxide hydrolase-like predicted phosphatase
MPIRAVIFDLGGVVMPSPLDVFRAYEARHGLPHRFISDVVVAGGDHGAWSRLERGELDPDGFATAFEAECANAGGQVSVPALLEAIAAGPDPHPEMLDALRRIRARGLLTAALTNNWATRDGDRSGTRVAGLGSYFDVVVESAVEGLRKPDPRIYELTCARLDVGPDEAVFLDDLGVNLKSARALGMTTIKVSDVQGALDELASILGFALADGAVATPDSSTRDAAR